MKHPTTPDEQINPFPGLQVKLPLLQLQHPLDELDVVVEEPEELDVVVDEVQTLFTQL